MHMYKVVRKTEEGWKSARIIKGICCLSYNTEEFTEAPINGILVFETIDKAIDFINDQFRDFQVTRGKLHLFKAECEGEVESFRSIWANILYQVGYGNVNDTFENLLKYIERHGDIMWPKGTKAFKKVKLLEEINLVQDIAGLLFVKEFKA